jgi:hypothetical protein
VVKIYTDTSTSNLRIKKFALVQFSLQLSPVIISKSCATHLILGAALHNGATQKVPGTLFEQTMFGRCQSCPWHSLIHLGPGSVTLRRPFCFAGSRLNFSEAAAANLHAKNSISGCGRRRCLEIFAKETTLFTLLLMCRAASALAQFCGWVCKTNQLYGTLYDFWPRGRQINI